MLASDVNNQKFVGAVDPDSVMIARFYIRAVKNNFKSKQENRPIFEDKIYCEYYPAGNTLLKMNVPSTSYHERRFMKQWMFFKSNQQGDQREIGTPLSQWTILSPSDVENLKGLKFNTIDQVAGCSDLQLQSLGMGIAGMAPHVLRARAQAFLGAAQDTKLPQKQAEEIEILKKEMKERDEKHAKEMAEIKAMISAQKPEVKHQGKKTRVWTEEQKQAARDRFAKAGAKKVKHGIDPSPAS